MAALDWRALKGKETINENMKEFVKAVEADEVLKGKIAALEGADDALSQAITIAAEHGYALAEEDFAALTEDDFRGTGSTELSLDDLDAVAGGAIKRLYAVVVVV